LPGNPRSGVLHWAPLLTLLVLLGPVVAGLAGTLAPALGWYPTIPQSSLQQPPWRDLFNEPGIGHSIQLSITTGLAATLLSLALTVLVFAAWHGTRFFRVIERMLSPLLSVPHAAAALGLAFLIAPSGWIVRWLSPWLTGWMVPPDLLIVHDPHGITMIAGLVIKETPFLLLMTLAAANHTQTEQARTLALTMGYGRASAWIKVVFPVLYPQIRLPVYAVLAYSMTVVDVALILGPTTPPPLAVKILGWMNDPDLALRFRAAAAAILQLLLVLTVLGLWRLGEYLFANVARYWIQAGRRGRRERIFRAVSFIASVSITLSVTLGLAGLALWSVAGLWTFPDAVPQFLSLHSWQRHITNLADPTLETALIGIAGVFIALLLVLACLETEYRHGIRPTTRGLWLLYLPLLVPQVVFLPGLQILFSELGMEGNRSAVVLSHLVFVLPYVFLSLADPYRAWDRRNAAVAATLGKSENRIFLSLRLPMLLAPLLIATAIGFAVSVGQYLPTLLIGGGRITTLTTEAVALSSGGDRRIIGIFALAQATLPFIMYSVSIAVPALVYRNRRGMRIRH